MWTKPPGSIYNATRLPLSGGKNHHFFQVEQKKCAPRTQGLPNGSAKVTEKPNSYLHDRWLVFWRSTKKIPPVFSEFNSPNFWKVPLEIEGDFEKVTPPYDFVPYFFNQNNNWKGLTHSMNLAKRPTNPSFFGGKVKAQHSWFTGRCLWCLWHPNLDLYVIPQQHQTTKNLEIDAEVVRSWTGSLPSIFMSSIYPS